MAYKLDMKDIRLLRELDKNPDITVSRLAKNIGVSQQVADYRLKNLIKDKVIMAIPAWVDMGKLGYSLFRVHIRFKTISSEKKKEFEDYIFKNYKCFYIGSVGGRWDNYFDLFAKSPLEFEKNLEEIAGKFKEEIQEFETFTILRIHVFNYKYLFDNTISKEFVFNQVAEINNIDQTDNKILQIIKYDSRIPYLQIGQKIGLTRNAVKERIKKLHQRKIIVANRIILNPDLMGKESYKILFKLKSDNEQKKKLLGFAKINKNIIYALELMGQYQLDFEIEIENREKLQELLIELRNNFPIIQDYEIMPLFYDYGFDLCPLDK